MYNTGYLEYSSLLGHSAKLRYLGRRREWLSVELIAKNEAPSEIPVSSLMVSEIDALYSPRRSSFQLELKNVSYTPLFPSVEGHNRCRF